MRFVFVHMFFNALFVILRSSNVSQLSIETSSLLLLLSALLFERLIVVSYSAHQCSCPCAGPIGRAFASEDLCRYDVFA